MISATGHGALITLAYVGLPVLFEPAPVANIPITVEIVTIAEETAAPRPEPKPEPEAPKTEPEPTPEPEPVVAEAPPEPEPPPPPPEQRPEPPVALAALDPEPEPDPAPPPERKPAPEPAANKAPPKPRIKPKKKPRLAFDADRIAALLDKEEEEPPSPKPLVEAEPPPDERPTARISNISDRLTLSELDAIRAQIQRCWSVPGGARDGHELIVTIRIYLNPDGSLSRPPEIGDASRMADPYYLTMAESAVRAVRKCEPLRVPSTKYEDWREIELTFNPREMLGG